MNANITAGQSVTFPFGEVTLTGVVAEVRGQAVVVRVADDAPVMAGRDVWLSVEDVPTEAVDAPVASETPSTERTVEQVETARVWVAECHERRGMAPADVAVRYVENNYPGGWSAFVTDVCTSAVTLPRN